MLRDPSGGPRERIPVRARAHNRGEQGTGALVQSNPIWYLWTCPILPDWHFIYPHYYRASFSKQRSELSMAFVNFTKLPQELRDQIWAEAAALQRQQVRGNFLFMQKPPASAH